MLRRAAILLFLILPACTTVQSSASAPAPTLLKRTEPLGQLLRYAAVNDPQCAPWFAKLSEFDQFLIAATLDRATFTLTDGILPKYPSVPSWTFAETPPRIAIQSPQASPPKIQITVLSTDIVRTISSDSDRRRCKLLITWHFAHEGLSTINVPLNPDVYRFTLDFSYVAKPQVADEPAAEPLAAPNAALRSELYGIATLERLPGDRIRLIPSSPSIYLITNDIHKNGELILARGETVLPDNIDLLGAGATTYTYLGSTPSGCRFIVCDRFYDNPPGYSLIDVPPYGPPPRPKP